MQHIVSLQEPGGSELELHSVDRGLEKKPNLQKRTSYQIDRGDSVAEWAEYGETLGGYLSSICLLTTKRNLNTNWI